MAVYKVIQDIEAEDKLLGPLSLKGFVYAATAALLGFINFKLLVSEALGPVKWVFIFLFIFPMILFAVLASPLGREQPTEVWLLARIKFLLKPRQRIWSQLGLNQLVTITAPKKEEQHLIKDLSQNEVQSRLQVLAQTLDTRGWAVKNVAVNLNTSPDYLQAADQNSDRLIGTDVLNVPAPVIDVRPDDDILDAQSNPTAQNFQSLMQQAEETRKKELADKLEQARKTGIISKPSAPKESNDTKELLNEMHKRAQFYTGKTDTPSVTPEVQTAKLELAQSGNDLSVATIANLVNRGSDEIVVPLH
ncbi:MAG TPA: PrgI family protein [Candidatus Saccharimonadales bacterium]|nr:PrgI family protein [Candidatus Saccharimonadales bacterium]